VPANASAQLHLPYRQTASVHEGGVPVGRALGVVVSSLGNGVAVLDVGSGSYRFTST